MNNIDRIVFIYEKKEKFKCCYLEEQKPNKYWLLVAAIEPKAFIEHALNEKEIKL